MKHVFFLSMGAWRKVHRVSDLQEMSLHMNCLALE